MKNLCLNVYSADFKNTISSKVLNGVLLKLHWKMVPPNSRQTWNSQRLLEKLWRIGLETLTHPGIFKVQKALCIGILIVKRIHPIPSLCIWHTKQKIKFPGSKWKISYNNLDESTECRELLLSWENMPY